MRGRSRKECRRGEMVRCYSLVFGRGRESRVIVGRESRVIVGRESRVRVIGRKVEEGEGWGVVVWGRCQGWNKGV